VCLEENTIIFGGNLRTALFSFGGPRNPANGDNPTVLSKGESDPRRVFNRRKEGPLKAVIPLRKAHFCWKKIKGQINPGVGKVLGPLELEPHELARKP